MYHIKKIQKKHEASFQTRGGLWPVVHAGEVASQSTRWREGEGANLSSHPCMYLLDPKDLRPWMKLLPFRDTYAPQKGRLRGGCATKSTPPRARPHRSTATAPSTRRPDWDTPYPAPGKRHRRRKEMARNQTAGNRISSLAGPVGSVDVRECHVDDGRTRQQGASSYLPELGVGGMCGSQQ
jgi:hypothetical protein